MSRSVTDSDACGTDWDKWIPQIDSVKGNCNFSWRPPWKNFRIKLCSQDNKVLDNTSGYLVPLKMQFLMTHHMSAVQKIICNSASLTVESINSTEELLEIKVKSFEGIDFFTDIERALASEIDDIVMKPVQRLEFTSSLAEELFKHDLKEKNIDLMRDETNIFIVGFDTMRSIINKNMEEINRATASKVVQLEEKWKIKAFKCFGFAETFSRNFSGVDFRLEEHSSSIFLRGKDVTVIKAEEEVHKLMSELFHKKFEVHPLILKLLVCKEASELFKNILQKQHPQVIWTIDKTRFHCVSKTKIDTDALKSAIYDNFLTAGFSTSSHHRNQFCNSNAYIEVTKKENKKLLFLETTKSSVNIAGIKSLIFYLLYQEMVFYEGVGNTKKLQELLGNSQQRMNMIKVSDITAGSSEDSIRFFFENKRKSGGGAIADLDYDEDSHSAIITFEEGGVAERVISRLPLLFEKKGIAVEIFMPCQLTSNVVEDGKATVNDVTRDMPTEFAIEVRGMKPTTSEDTIRLCFESRKGANADVVKMELFKAKGMYIIWFKKESAIETVMNKDLIVDEEILNIKRYVPPTHHKHVPKYDNKVFITNISLATTRDGLENFLEAKSECILVEIIFGETKGTALVTFEQPPDIDKLSTVCLQRRLDGSHLSIHTVPITDCIVVTGYKDYASSDTMENYFDDKRRSGVEGVREVKLVEAEGKCLVYFADPDSALEVCKRCHTVMGHILKVDVYYECLGQSAFDDEGPQYKPLSTVIQNIHPYKIEFLLNSNKSKMTFEKQLLRHYATVEWPHLKKITESLVVHCTLNKGATNYRKLTNSWTRTVSMDVNTFFNMLTVKVIKTLQEAWEDVLKHLREINISNPESVAIRVVKEDCKMVIVGHKIPVEEVAEKVENIMKDVAAEHDRRKLQITEEVSLKPFQLLVLLYLHFLDKMKKEFEGLCVQVNMKKDIMIFTGMSSHVIAAKIKMFEQIQEIASAVAGKFSDGYIEFLKIPEVKSYVGQQIKQKGVLGVWNVEEGNVITMYSLSDEGAVTACNVLKKSIIEAPIHLDYKQSALIGSDVWYDEINYVQMKYQKAFVKIVVADAKTVVIYQTSAEDVGLVKENILDIFWQAYAS